MNVLNAEIKNKVERPIKVIQFGEGNFLRAFVDYMIDIANESGEFDGNIVLVKPITFGTLERFHNQDCNYTVSLRGITDGVASVTNRIVTSVADVVGANEEYEKYASYAKLDTLRFVVSNTTEAGIVYDETDKFELCPPTSYPGKLCKFLYERYEAFNGDMSKGLVMLPVELIDDNGIHLKECVLKQIENWGLGDDFKNWVENACVFCATLVDRIVTGYPRGEEDKLWSEWGYKDELMVTGEPFALWVIECPKDISGELPLDKAGLPVIYTKDHHPYKQRKVRILNGAHTASVLAGYLCNDNIVLEMMEDKTMYNFINSTVYDEIIPTLTLPKDELVDFAEAVFTRFRNPYVKHQLLSIALNSVSKWVARCFPSFLGYIEKTGELPKKLTFSLAALMAFYSATEMRDGILIGHRDGAEYEIKDDAAVLEFFAANSTKSTKEFVTAFLGFEKYFGQDLNKIAGLNDLMCEYLDSIKSVGCRATMEKYFA